MINEQGKLLFGAFIVVLIGVVLIQSIGTDIDKVKVGSVPVINESLTVAASIILANDELISFDGLRNATAQDETGLCDVTLATGTLSCNTSFAGTIYADYTYEPDTYVRSNSTRTILSLVLLFFALAILAIGIGFAWKSLKQGGVI